MPPPAVRPPRVIQGMRMELTAPCLGGDTSFRVRMVPCRVPIEPPAIRTSLRLEVLATPPPRRWSAAVDVGWPSR